MPRSRRNQGYTDSGKLHFPEWEPDTLILLFLRLNPMIEHYINCELGTSIFAGNLGGNKLYKTTSERECNAF